ncbi:MAG: lipopolysaccharide assembly LapA domain-containing protein [Ectothiorhodospira sp.]
MSRLILILFSIVAVLLGASFTVINSNDVAVNLYLQTFQVPMALVVFVSMFIGAVLGGMACSGLVMRRGRDMRQLRKKCKRAEDEIARLRQLPSTGKV